VDERQRVPVAARVPFGTYGRISLLFAGLWAVGGDDSGVYLPVGNAALAGGVDGMLDL
jgi:hypothetical protein